MSCDFKKWDFIPVRSSCNALVILGVFVETRDICALCSLNSWVRAQKWNEKWLDEVFHHGRRSNECRRLLSCLWSTHNQCCQVYHIYENCYSYKAIFVKVQIFFCDFGHIRISRQKVDDKLHENDILQGISNLKW